MSQQALQAVERAIAALTYEEAEEDTPRGPKAVPLLGQSIANDLRELDRQIATTAGRTLTRLFANAEAIDEALLALVEARKELMGAGQ